MLSTYHQPVPNRRTAGSERTAAGPDLLNVEVSQCRQVTATSLDCRQREDGSWEPDPLIMDERYLAVNIAGRGLVVFSACSHAGIVNVVQDAAAVSGMQGALLAMTHMCKPRQPVGGWST